MTPANIAKPTIPANTLIANITKDTTSNTINQNIGYF
jgi:hypothetical protein